MNDKQKAIAITGSLGTLGAEALIGGLGIGLLGTAVAVPASAVVATVSAIAWIAAGDNTPIETKLASKSVDQITDRDMSRYMLKGLVKSINSDPTPELTSYLLKKGTVTHKISVNKKRGWGQTCLQATSNAKWTNYRYFSNIQELRDLYKVLLDKGYQPA